MALIDLISELKAAYAKTSGNCGKELLPPASEQDIHQLEASLNLSVPEELKELLRIHGGQNYISPGITGLFGSHRLHTPLEIVEHYHLYLSNDVDFPFDERPPFPPPLDEWGYWVPELIPFASWDAYDLCIHTSRYDVWEFCPNIGLTLYMPNIAEVLRFLIEVVAAGQEPKLLETAASSDRDLRGMAKFL